ncbi:MAG: hypothetical protein AAGD92_12545 [Pseudomonadota bacterium]
MIPVHDFFIALVALHIVAGLPGLISFWAPIFAKKGGAGHRFWGRIFTASMLLTGCIAIMMSTTTLIAPLPTHPHLHDHPIFSQAAQIRGIFGWMMLYLALLTINLAWYGWRAVRHRADHARNRGPVNLALQGLLGVAAVNCAIQGALIGQPMMIGISFVGVAAVGTNLWFILRPEPAFYEWRLEHIKAIVGAGISVYTAFLAFGAVRLAPQLALAPGLWAAPMIVGLSLIFYHRRVVRLRYGKSEGAVVEAVKSLWRRSHGTYAKE